MQFMHRPDVRQNFFKALLKRLWWRIRWLTTDQLYLIKFAENLNIGLPKTGSASLIYYQGYSEFEVADLINRLLRPEMVFLDVGAHIGEYTILAAKIVGTSGQVHSFEPQDSLFRILKENVQMNKLSNVTLNCSAISEVIGETGLEIFKDLSVSSINKRIVATRKAERVIQVACTSLDAYWSNFDYNIDLIKVDVEGAEKFVFQGAKQLLKQPWINAPIWLFEYSPTAYHTFGYQPKDILQLLADNDYQVWQYEGHGNITKFDSAKFKSASQVKKHINLIAAKNQTYLLSLLHGEKKPVKLFFSNY